MAKPRLTYKNIKGFLQGNQRKFFFEMFDMLPQYMKEVVTWRLERVKIKSPKCLEKDECVHCGCQVSSKVFEDRGCSDHHKCYPPMPSKEEWEEYKLKREEYRVYHDYQYMTIEELEDSMNRLDQEMESIMLYGKPVHVLKLKND